MKPIIRVFPRRTSLTPSDPYAFVGDPPLWRPEAEQVLVSCCFIWDKGEALRLQQAWGQYYRHVELGGPAFGSDGEFVPGQFVKQGVTFTTRGCNSRCPWCLVPEREGRLRELPITPGYIIQDNNLLQASRGHIEQVFAMLRSQRKAAVFSGGLEAALMTDWVAEELQGLRIDSLFLACDTEAGLKPLRKAFTKLSFLPRRKLRCYVLIGFQGESIGEAEARLEAVWEAGALPFSQLYQPADSWIEYSPAWKALDRTWSRPAAMFAEHRESPP